MAVDLKYNLDEYSKAINNIKQLKSQIKSNKTKMINDLEIIRNDWTLDGGKEFFASVDEDWADGIDNCIDVFDDLIDALENSYKQYEKIEKEAKKVFKNI